MSNKYYSHNGTVLPNEEAVVRLDNIQYSYGYGVYETLRVSHGITYFIDQHIERLFNSASIIDLEHQFDADFVKNSISKLLHAGETTDCNLKILLIGGQKSEVADLYILVLNPLYPDRKLYRDGAHATTYHYERFLPHAKTLNMLPSYLAYQTASKAGAYDALLVNDKGYITEGSRTNFFCIKDTTIVSPPKSQLLLGVMRAVVLKIIRDNNFTYTEKDIPIKELELYDGAFLTSTSSKIMPLRSVDNFEFPAIPAVLIDLRYKLDDFLKNCNGKMAQ